jgi:hypothetical protein
MIRGICFEVPHDRFPVLYLITKGINVGKYFWILVEDDVLRDWENYFEKDRYPGSEFEDVIKDKNCYAVSINLQAYINESDFANIRSYNDFVNSKCELIIFINDNTRVDIYAKDLGQIEIIKRNAEQNRFEDIMYITEENDQRTGPKGFSA